MNSNSLLRSLKTFDNKRKQGLHIGAFVCYGYKRNDENKQDRMKKEIIKTNMIDRQRIDENKQIT